MAEKTRTYPIKTSAGRPRSPAVAEKRLKALILNGQGFTQIEIAERLGVAQTTVSKYLQEAEKLTDVAPKGSDLDISRETGRLLKKIARNQREVYRSLPKSDPFHVNEQLQLINELKDAILLQGVQLNTVTNAILHESIQPKPDTKLIDALERAANVCTKCILTLDKIGVPGWRDPQILNGITVEGTQTIDLKATILSALDEYPEVKKVILDKLYESYNESVVN